MSLSTSQCIDSLFCDPLVLCKPIPKDQAPGSAWLQGSTQGDGCFYSWKPCALCQGFPNPLWTPPATDGAIQAFDSEGSLRDPSEDLKHSLLQVKRDLGRWWVGGSLLLPSRRAQVEAGGSRENHSGLTPLCFYLQVSSASGEAQEGGCLLLLLLVLMLQPLL